MKTQAQAQVQVQAQIEIKVQQLNLNPEFEPLNLGSNLRLLIGIKRWPG